MTAEKQPHATFGTHEAWFVEPDELRFVFRGEFTEEHADPYLKFAFGQCDRVGRSLYCVYDLSAFTRATEGGRKRKRVVTPGRPYPYLAMAVVGTGFSTQIAANMILTAGKLVSPKHFEFPIRFFQTVVEAAAWFDQLRTERQTQGDGP